MKLFFQVNIDRRAFPESGPETQGWRATGRRLRTEVWVCAVTLPLMNGVTSAKGLERSVPPFPHLERGMEITPTLLSELLGTAWRELSEQ